MKKWIFKIITLLICLFCQSCATSVDNNIGLSHQLNVSSVKSRVEKGIWLSLNHIKQEKGELMCVPSSAAMVLAYYGDARRPREIRILALGRDVKRRIPFKKLVIGLRSLGYYWYTRSYECNETGFLLPDISPEKWTRG